MLHLLDRRDHDSAYGRLLAALNDGALRAIGELGWTPMVHAAAEAGVAGALAVARNADMVLLMGGEDVHPDFYGGPLDYPEGGRHEPAADEAQIAVVQDAAGRGTPVLGICRGMQLLNVAFGGDLVQHLPQSGHRAPPGGRDPFVLHRVQVREDSGFDAAVDELVQSGHHQAIGRLGAGLRTVAVGEDGVIEAVVHEQAPVTGVQWHPEHLDAPAGQLTRLLRRLESQLR
ncbi:MAG: gamma-glutamyl-gamma-aminobutyrate hydrolase family protein [Actinomycetota bacterium]|nr:gamma-glutamyl-gamma-aminobutyrate hydrolase family protein [Actinomycetota bacterium]